MTYTYIKLPLLEITWRKYDVQGVYGNATDNAVFNVH